jgi:hypothetical protein
VKQNDPRTLVDVDGAKLVGISMRNEQPKVSD